MNVATPRHALPAGRRQWPGYGPVPKAERARDFLDHFAVVNYRNDPYRLPAMGADWRVGLLALPDVAVPLLGGEFGWRRPRARRGQWSGHRIAVPVAVSLATQFDADSEREDREQMDATLKCRSAPPLAQPQTRQRCPCNSSRTRGRRSHCFTTSSDPDPSTPGHRRILHADRRILHSFKIAP